MRMNNDNQNTVVKATEKQREILAFIREFTSIHGYSPTVREIGSAVGLSSTSSVQCYLDKMENYDLITKGNSPRTLRVIDPEFMEGRIPVLKKLGGGTEEKNLIGHLTMPWNYGNSNMVCVNAKENNLDGEYIDGTDMVVIRLTRVVEDGRIAVVRSDNGFHATESAGGAEVVGEVIGCISPA